MGIYYQAAAPTGSSTALFILWVVGLGVFFWFFMIRPQSQQQKKHKNLISGIKRGDRVVMNGGLHGIVAELKDDVVVLRVAPKIDLTFQRSAIQSVVGKLSKEDQKKQEREKSATELDASDLTDSDGGGQAPQ